MSYPKLTPIIAKGATEPRYLEDRFVDIVNVKDYGAIGDGVVDDTAAFQAAADVAITKAIDNRQTLAAANVAMSAEVTIFIPHGTYKITSRIFCNGVHIRWKTSAETKIVGIDYLGGVVEFGSRKVSNSIPYGSADRLNGFFVQEGANHKTEASLSEFNSYSGIVPYSLCDVVPLVSASYDETTLVATVENASFSGNTLTGLSNLTNSQWDKLRKGMRCVATNGINRYIASITGWSKTDQTISFDGGWYERGGSTTPTSAPEGYTVLINGQLSFFGGHFLVSLTNGSVTAERVNVQENIYRNTDENVVCTKNSDYQGGYSSHLYDARCYGEDEYNRANVGYVARGNMWYGFAASKSQTEGFAVRGCSEGADIKSVGFVDYTGKGTAFSAIGSSGRQVFAVSGSDGHLELGDREAVTNAYIDFHTSGDSQADYDSRIRARNDDSNNVLDYISTYHLFSGTAVRPDLDDTTNLGVTTYRWKNIYASNGTISTSDERLKTIDGEVNESVMRAWGKVNFKSFRMNNAIAEKGLENARIHIGVIAQEVKTAFESEGLDAFKYGLLCYDKWDDEFTEIDVIDVPFYIDEDGIEHSAVTHKERHQVQKAGEIYSIRYEEALALECAYQRWRLKQLEERINQLTNPNN